MDISFHLSWVNISFFVYVISVSLIFKEIVKLFSRVAVQFNQCMRVLVSSCLWKYLLLSFLIIAILVGLKWYSVILIWISLMPQDFFFLIPHDFEHLFMFKLFKSLAILIFIL